MSTGALDIGTLSGRIELDDNISSTMNLILSKVDALEERFGGMGKHVAETAAGFITAEAAIEGVKKVLEFTIETIKDFTSEGAQIAHVEENFERLTNQAGRLGATLLGELKAGTKSTITDFELIKMVNGDLAAGMNLTDKQFRTLADGGFALAKAKGIDVAQAMDIVNDAMLTGRTRSLALLTGKIDLAAAEERYATTLGTTSDKLTAEGKIEAARMAILESVGKATSKLGEQTIGLDDIIAQARTKWNNWYEDLAKSVASSPHVVHAFEAIRDSVVSLIGGDGEHAMDVTIGFVEHVADAVASYGPVVIGWFAKAKDWVVDLYRTVVTTWDGLPQWMKDVAENSALALGGLVLLDGAVGIATTGITDMISAASNMTQILTGIPALLTMVSGGLATMSTWMGVLDFTSLADASASFKLIGSAVGGVIGPMGALALAVGAVMAAWEVGKMKPVSDFFEKLGLRLSGMTSAEADARIEMEHTVDAQRAQAEASKPQYDAAAKIKEIMEQLKAAEHGAAVSTTEHTDAQDKNRLVMAQSTEEAKKQREALLELKSIGASYDMTIKGINKTTLESIKTFLDAGASQSVLASAYGVTSAQIKAIDDQMKLEKKTLDDAAGRWADYNALIADLSGDSTKQLIADTEKWKEEQIKSHKTAKTDTADFYDWLGKTETAMYEKADKARLEADTHSKAYFDKIARDAQAAYDFALKHSEQFTSGYISDLGKTADAARKTAANWTSALGGSMDAVAKQVRTLSGEMISLEEQSKRMSSGGSTEINRANLAANAKTFGIPESVAFEMAKRGFSFQEMIAAWQSQMVASWVPHGPKIAGFRDGGVGDFGDGTLAVLHGKEAIVPLDGHAGGLGGVHNTFYVNGTAEESARKISQILMRDLKQNRQFSNL